MNTWDHASIEQHVILSYDELSVEDASQVRIEAGDYSTEMFLDPNHFPMRIDGDKINVKLLYGPDEQELTVQRASASYSPTGISDSWGDEASMETMGMTTYQRTVAFLYLVGKVLNE